MRAMTAILAALGLLTLPAAASAREYPVGGPVQAHDMEIAASYLTGIRMAPMPPGMAMGSDVVHLETDVHATADNQYRPALLAVPVGFHGAPWGQGFAPPHKIYFGTSPGVLQWLGRRTPVRRGGMPLFPGVLLWCE